MIDISDTHREPPEEKTEEKVVEKTSVTEEIEAATVSLSPMEVLKTRIFYKIWLGQFAIALAQVAQIPSNRTHCCLAGSFIELEENLWLDADHL